MLVNRMVNSPSPHPWLPLPLTPGLEIPGLTVLEQEGVEGRVPLPVAGQPPLALTLKAPDSAHRPARDRH
jgi:hypothetical protein